MKYVNQFWAAEQGIWSYWIDKWFWSCGSHEEPALINQKRNHSFLYCFKLFNIISFQMFPRTISKHTGNFIGISKHTEFLPLQNRNTSYVTSSQREWWRNSNDVDTWHPHGPQRSCEGTGRASKRRRSPVSPFPSLTAGFTMQPHSHGKTFLTRVLKTVLFPPSMTLICQWLYVDT